MINYTDYSDEPGFNLIPSSNKIASWMKANWEDCIDESGEVCMTSLSESCAIYYDTDVHEIYFEVAFNVCQDMIKRGILDRESRPKRNFN